MRGLGPALFLLAAALAAPGLACDYPGGPPDAQEVRAEGDGVTWAYFSNATEVYGHGVLGDAIEARALRAETPLTGPCESMAYLDEMSVFEDVTPRIADVTGDGLNDVVVIETRMDAGASLAVYGMADGKFVKIAATPYIGRSYRWLAPAGIADFNRDGVKDVAYVETPHIGGILRIWSFKGGIARELASEPGYSNHRIGQNFITGGVRDCGRGPELVLPDAGWRQTRLAWLYGDVIEGAVLAEDAEPETIEKALECP
ncbi:MAG: VCBS repeat-containing protein [Paracoccaceae bacterium]|nr:VCBS repeat-containing protein [Paracoccaceae bacterium]